MVSYRLYRYLLGSLAGMLTYHGINGGHVILTVLWWCSVIGC